MIGTVVGLRQTPEHLHGHGCIGPGRGHGHDGVGAGLLGRACKEQHLGHRDARAAEDHRQPSVDLLQHGIQVADALLLAQKVELADHHRPDNAVLSAATAEIGRRPQVRRQDLIVLSIGVGNRPKTPLRWLKRGMEAPLG